MEINCAVVVDASVAPIWTQGGLESYLNRVIGLLQAFHQPAKASSAISARSERTTDSKQLRAVPILIGPPANQVSRGQAVESIQALMVTLNTGLASLSEKGKSRASGFGGVSHGLLKGILAGVEELENHSSDASWRHLILVANSDLPSSPLHFPEQDAILSTTAWSPEMITCTSWSDLAGQLNKAKVAFTLVAARFLAGLEALQKQVSSLSGADNLPAHTIAVANPEQAVLMPTLGTRPKEAAKAPADSMFGRARETLNMKPSDFAAMNKEELLAREVLLREDANRIFQAIQTSVDKRSVPESKAIEMRAQVQQQIARQLAFIADALKAHSATFAPSVPSQGSYPSVDSQSSRYSSQSSVSSLPSRVSSDVSASSVATSMSSASAVSPKPPANAPLWQGQLVWANTDVKTGQRQEHIMYAAISPAQPLREPLGFNIPSRLEITASFEHVITAVHDIATKEALPVLKIETVAAHLLDDKAPGQGLSLKNSTLFHNFVNMLATRHQAAFVRIPGFGQRNGLLMIAMPPQQGQIGPRGLIAIPFIKVELTEAVAKKKEASAHAAPPQQQQQQQQRPVPPAPHRANAHDLHALQAMLGLTKTAM